MGSRVKELGESWPVVMHRAVIMAAILLGAGCAPAEKARSAPQSETASASLTAIQFDRSLDGTTFPDCGGIFGLCGYADRSDRHDVIDKTFDGAMPFSQGLAAVQVNGLWGYIDSKGTIRIKPMYDLAGPFHEGMAEVVIDGKAGVISQNGAFLITPQFARAIPLTVTVVVVQSGTYQNSRIEGFERLDGFGPLMTKPGKAGLYRIGHGWLTPEVYEFSVFDKDNNHLIWARDTLDPARKNGLMREDGSWAVKPAFDHVQWLNDGRAIVTTEVREMDSMGRAVGAPHSLWGAVDASGQIVIPLKYDWLSYWNGGYSVVRLNGEEGLLDADGKLLGGQYYQKAKRGDENEPLLVQKGGQWFAISRTGKLGPVPPSPVRPPRAAVAQTVAEAKSDCGTGVDLIWKNGNWGLKGPDGKVLIPPRYDAISCFINGVVWVPDNAKHAWCPLGPDGQPRQKPDCRKTYYAIWMSHHSPEQLDPDPYLSSVLWMRAYLANGKDPDLPRPRMIGDGVRSQGSHSIIRR